MANIKQELNSVKYDSFDKITAKMRELSAEYSSMPIDSLNPAFTAATMFGTYQNDNPYVQNTRVKQISTRAVPYRKPEIEDMIANVADNELPLRQVEKALEAASYPLFHLRTVYQNLLTYHNYVAPYLSNDGDSAKPEFWREWKLLEKLRTEMEIKSKAHELTGIALQEGKVFVYPRVSTDKAHNKVNYAFIQQLPSDWTKIVGFNNRSKYTLAFNLMYFTKPGTDIRQFGDLFTPYIDTFNKSIYPAPVLDKGRIVYASKSKINMRTASDPNTEVYYQNGRWFYWVILPVDKVYTIEIDDTNRNVVSPFTGLFIDMLQLVAYENLQLELIQNPLISILTGEIPYFEDSQNNIEDRYKLSNAGRMLFESFWYQMLARNNTGGIGLYAAPFKNMELHQLAEAPSALQISSTGYGYTLSKAGLSGIIPTSSDTRSGMAQISLSIESRFAQAAYDCFERMFNGIISSLNLKFSWRFFMFGSIATDEAEINEARNGMTLGILPSTMRYLALKDMSIFDDMSLSAAIIDSGLLEMRRPLVSSYNAGDTTESKSSSDSIGVADEGGRPESETVSSEGKESDIDSPPPEE